MKGVPWSKLSDFGYNVAGWPDVPKKNGWVLKELELIHREAEHIHFVKSLATSLDIGSSTDITAMEFDTTEMELDLPPMELDLPLMDSLTTIANVSGPRTDLLAPASAVTDPGLLPILFFEPVEHVAIESYAEKLEGLYKKNPGTPARFLIWLQCQPDWAELEEKLGLEHIKRLIPKYRKKHKDLIDVQRQQNASV